MGLSPRFGRGGNPTTRPVWVTNARADGARVNAGGGGDGDSCLEGIPRASLSGGRRGVELLAETGTSGTSDVFSTSCGREITPFDGLRSTVTMVA